MSSAAFTGTARFALEARLGAGGDGVVWAARDAATGRRVALKTLAAPSPRAVLRLRREFQAAQAVSHPNLVTLDELHQVDGHWFLTMELVEGVELLDWVRPPDGAGRLDVARLRACLAQLGDAVDAIHAAGLLHRDLKPSNVLVDRDGRVVVLDLGLAGGGDLDDDDRGIAGTPAYMAPEQAAAQPLGPPADWYAVGALLYHALTGRPPFAGAAGELGDAAALLVKKQHEEPAPPRAIDPSVPADLDELCRGLLAIDPRRRPTPATIARGGASRAATSHTLGRPGLFVGRDRELAALEEALEGRGAGPAVVVVAGASGVGKSALVRHFTDGAAIEHAATILSTRCHEREHVAGGGVLGLVEALAKELRALPPARVAAVMPRRAHLLAQAYPVLRTVSAFAAAPRDDAALVDPFTRRARVIDALRELLARLADRRVVVIVLDDAQWADAETLAVLDSVLAPPEAPAVLVIATWRPAEGRDEPPPTFAGARRLELAPLDDAAALALAADLLARGAAGAAAAAGVALSADDAAALARESGGHPLLLDALVGHALAGGGAAGRRTLADAVAARLDALDPAARALFDAIAVAGAPVDEELLARATGVPSVGVGRALAALRVARLTRVARRGDRALIEPYHDQLRAVALARLGADGRRALHAAFAIALESRGDADPERLVDHLRGAGEHAAAARHAAAAAAAAYRALAFHRTAELYTIALELGGADGGLDARALRLARADALAAAGRGAEAAADFLACVDGAAPGERLELQRQAAQQLLVTGHTTEGLAAIREVLAAEGLPYPASPRRALAQVAWRRAALAVRGVGFGRRDLGELAPRELARIDVCWHVGLGLSIVDTMRGHAFHVRGLLLALRAGEPRRIARALALDIAYRGTRGSPVTAAVERLYAVAHRMADELGDPHALALAIGCRGVAAFLRGDFADAARWCLEAATSFQERCRGVPWELATAKLFGTRALLAMGDVDGLRARTDADLREFRDRGDLYGETSMRAAVLPHLHLLRGDAAAARAEADDALARWQPGSFQVQHYYQVIARATVDLHDGDPARGLARLDEALPAVRAGMFLRVQAMRATIVELRARLHLAAAATAPAAARAAHLRAARADARRLAGEGPRWTRALARAIEAGAAARDGRADDARAALAAAAAELDGAQLALVAAAARRRLGELVGGDAGAAAVAAADRELVARGVAAAAVGAVARLQLGW